MSRKPNYYAYAAPSDERSQKPWRMIGAAWDNNGYISVSLDAFPAPGMKLLLGPPKDDNAGDNRETAKSSGRRDSARTAR